jgi:2,3-bisphosphoglycerate-independent phosphoglycerate mutase
VRVVIVVPDGMADRPADFPDGRTPLELARTPNLDALARAGECGVATTVPDSLVPGSDVANMAVLGVDPTAHRVGRAAIEAAGRGVTVGRDEVVFRMNLVTIDADGRMADYSAGGIDTERAAVLVEAVAEALAPLGARVTLGVAYRHLVCVKDAGGVLASVRCTPPHDILGKSAAAHAPRGPGAETVLALHEAAARALAGRSKIATAVWMWGQGTAARLPGLGARFGVSGAVITAVDLVRGLGRATGMDVIEVDGATGDVDTNYAGKGEAAAAALDTHEVVFVHVEAPDEASHRGERDNKIRAIEDIDREVLSRVRRAADARRDARVLVMPDHLTPLAIRTHAHGAVPYVLYGPQIAPSGAARATERAAASTGIVCARGWELLPRALGCKGY